MAGDKIPITSEKVIKYEGYFDIKHTYEFVKHFLESSRHYDLTERDYDEKNLGSEKSLVSLTEAQQEFTDYYKVILKYEIKMSGHEEEVKINGKVKKLVKGNAKLTINSYIQPDFLGRKPKSPISKFLEQLYNRYIGNDEINKCIESTVIDVAQLTGRFKQTLNATLK